MTHLGKDALACCIHVDILILNARVWSRSAFLETIPEVNAEVMQVNFLPGALLAKTIVPGMIQQHTGALVWISNLQSVSNINLKHCVTQVGLPERTYNVASKFATQSYSEGLHAELAASGVQVFVACTGYIRTNLSQSTLTGDGSPCGKLDATTATGTFCLFDLQLCHHLSSSSHSDSHNVSFTCRCQS